MRRNITTILVDDEQDSLSALREQVGMYCPQVEILGSYTDSILGLEKILKLRPDVVFLDIQMPKKSGLEAAKEIVPTGIKVVFVSAYQKYAIDAIKLSALDYLLKPLEDGGALRTIIQKVEKSHYSSQQIPIFQQLLQNEKSESYGQETEIGLADEKGIYFYKINEIIRLKANRNCCEFFFTKGRKMLVTKNIGTFIEPLRKYNIIQVSKSEAINLSHRVKIVKRDGPYLVMDDGSIVSIKPKYKHNLPYFSQSSPLPFFLGR